MSGKAVAYSRLPEILSERRSTVADLLKKLTGKGAVFDKKTLYRLASHQPLQSVSLPIMKALCEELKVGLDDVISWNPPRIRLQRIDERSQERLGVLMEKNNEGTLTARERLEMKKLGEYAERISLENAKTLAKMRAKPRTKGKAAA